MNIQIQNTTQEENKKYVDMTQEELNESIKEQERHIKLMGIKDYDIRAVEKLKQDIQEQKERIKEKKEEYKRNIKFNQERIKESKRRLKEKEKYLKLEMDYIINQEYLLERIKDIKEKLLINPNYYKEILKE